MRARPLVAAIFGSAALFASQTAPASARHTSARHSALRQTVLVAGVPDAGVYIATIELAGMSSQTVRVWLQLGSSPSMAVLTRGLSKMRVTRTMAISGRRLVVRAAGRDGTLSVAVSMHRTGPLPGRGPLGDPGAWHPIFEDVFAGRSLNTSKWSTGWFGAGLTGPINLEEQQCYDPSQVTVGGGELDLRLVARQQTCPTGSGPVTRPYTSGIVTTRGKFAFTYGFFESRVWVPGTESITDWPAVWAVGTNWPADGELDVVEGLSGGACWHFHSLQTAAGGCSKARMTGGWHTFGADWGPGRVTYYYDGVPMATNTVGITASPMYLIVNLAVDRRWGGQIVAPAELRLQYVKVWQH